MSSHRILKTKPMDGLNFVLPNLVRFVCSWGRSPPYADPVYLFWNFWHTENVFACKSLMHHDEHAIFFYVENHSNIDFLASLTCPFSLRNKFAPVKLLLDITFSFCTPFDGSYWTSNLVFFLTLTYQCVA